jgi:hypothetical protein
MTTPQVMAVWGLSLNLIGVLILFRYGMPYRIETGGQSALLLEEDDLEAIAAERVYRRLGFLGICLVVIGTGLQILAVLTV